MESPISEALPTEPGNVGSKGAEGAKGTQGGKAKPPVIKAALGTPDAQPTKKRERETSSTLRAAAIVEIQGDRHKAKFLKKLYSQGG